MGSHNINILKKISHISQTYQQKLDQQYRKRNGIYYTGLKLCNSLVKEMIPFIVKEKKYLFFEPCVGIGNYVFSYLYQLQKYKKFSKDENLNIINNIYIADINRESLDVFKSLFVEFCLELYDIKLDINKWEKEHIDKRGCIFNSEISLDYIEPPFDGKRFDIVATNPPYLMLKMSSLKLDSKTYEKYKSLNKALGYIANKKFIYQSGTPNLYKLFIEEILRRYTTADALVSLLVPYSLMSDKYSFDLRKFLLQKTKIFSIKILQENTNQIQASQSMCAIFCKKSYNPNNNSISIIDNYLSDNQIEKIFLKKPDSIGVSLPLSEGNNIVGFTKKQLEKLKKLSRYPRIKNLLFIRVSSGEFDIWQNKKFLINGKDGYPVVKGRNISEFELKISEITDYVSYNIPISSIKKEDVQSNRIACQEISNQCIKKRVKWCPIPPNYILSNSCNYIMLFKNKYGITYNTLLGLLNSNVINWYFKTSSSRNHVSVFEINEFPIPVTKIKELKKLTELVDSYYASCGSNVEKENLLKKINSLSDSIYLD